MSEYNNEGVCQLYKPFILPQFLTWDKGTLFLPKDVSSSATKKMSRERSRPKPDRSSLPTCLWHPLKITVLPVAVCFFHWAHTKCCFIMNLITMPQFSPMLKQSGTWEQTHWSISVLPVTGYSETQDSYVLLTTDLSFHLQYFIALWFALPPIPHIQRLTPFMKQVLASTSQSQRMMSPPLEPTARVLGCVGCHSRHVTLLSKGLALRKRQYEERERRKASSNLCQKGKENYDFCKHLWDSLNKEC